MATNQPEAEMLIERLKEAGIPAMAMRSGGADVPGFLAAGHRDIMVPASAESDARELLNTEDRG